MNPSKSPLPPLAEPIRIKIKSMIPELSGGHAEDHAELLKTEANGNKTYGGTLLAEQISLMSRQLPIPDPEVCVSSFEHSVQWRLILTRTGAGVYFTSQFLQLLQPREREGFSFHFLRMSCAKGP